MEKDPPLSFFSLFLLGSFFLSRLDPFPSFFAYRSAKGNRRLPLFSLPVLCATLLFLFLFLPPRLPPGITRTKRFLSDLPFPPPPFFPGSPRFRIRLFSGKTSSPPFPPRSDPHRQGRCGKLITCRLLSFLRWPPDTSGPAAFLFFPFGSDADKEGFLKALVLFLPTCYGIGFFFFFSAGA